jgi:hypothetical protein
MNRRHDLWRTETDGALATEVDGFRLVVPLPMRAGGQVHFLVWQRQGPHKQLRLVRSGTEETVHAAMKSAERIVEQLMGRPLGAPLDPLRLGRPVMNPVSAVN